MSGHRPPSRFRRSPRAEKRRARRAFKQDGPGARLLTALGADYAYLFTLRVRELDPDVSDDPSGRFDPAVVAALYAAAARLFRSPFFMVLEPGEGGRLHAHVIAHRHDGPEHIPRESQRCKWLFDVPGMYGYLHKHDPLTFADLNDYTFARVLAPNGRTPRTRRHFLGPERLAWTQTNALSLTLYGPLPPVLSCGRCRGRHLHPCPTYRAAAAAARNEARNDLTDTALEVLGFRPVTPAGLERGISPLLPAPAAAAAAAAASSRMESPFCDRPAGNPPARETAHVPSNPRAPIPPGLLRRVQARARRRRQVRNEGRTGLPDWLKKRIESRSQTQKCYNEGTSKLPPAAETSTP